MPIRPENRARYPKDWPSISRRIREKAGNRCEGSPAFPDCRAENGRPHPETGSRVVLTVAHLDHQPENCADENLKAWCQRCHNTYDLPMRRRGIAERAKAAMAIGSLFSALLAALLAAGPAAAQMHEHPPTGHGFYSGYCCSGYTTRNGVATGDCAPIDAEHVQATPDGYLVTLEPGDHPTVRRRLQQLFRYPDADPANDRLSGSPEAMPPGDQHFHACVLPNSQQLRCLYDRLSGV